MKCLRACSLTTLLPHAASPPERALYREVEAQEQVSVRDAASTGYVEMLDLQAERKSRPGLTFAPDGEWQREFDASFPYEETRDTRLNQTSLAMLPD